MDKVFNSENFSISNYECCKKYFEQFSELTKTIQFPQINIEEGIDAKNKDKRILQYFGLPTDPEKLKVLETIVSPKNLECEGELSIGCVSESTAFNKRCYDDSIKAIPEQAKNLQTIKMLEERLKRFSQFEEQCDSFVQNLKYRSEIRIEDISSDDKIADLEVNKEIVFIIRVHQPFRYTVGIRNVWVPKFTHEIAVLGSNTIADFRDRILCPSDLGVSVDISDRVTDEIDPLIVPKAKELYSSSLIYIDGVLYHDNRNPNNEDYTKTVLEWASKYRNEVGPFKRANMNEVYFKDLTLRLGLPQLYQHQGDCEHLFCISDIRLLHSTDSLCRSDYPRYTAMATKSARYCMVCGTIVARLIVTECDRLSSDPSYLCDNCFKSYLYIDGKKIGTFKAYLYYDNSYMI